MSSTMHSERWARIVDHITGKHPSLLVGIHAVFEQMNRPGRFFDPWIVSVLAKRPPGYMPAASGNERRFIAILEDAREPPMERQVDLGGHEWIGRVDFRDPWPFPVALEVNSYSYHQSQSDVEADEARYDALRAAGHELVVIDEDLLWRRPRQVLELVRAARAAVRARVRSGDIGAIGA